MKGIMLPAFFVTILFALAGAGLIAFLGNYIVTWAMSWLWKILLIGVALLIMVVIFKSMWIGQLGVGRTFALAMLAVVGIAFLLYLFNPQMMIYPVTYNPVTQSVTTGMEFAVGGITFDLGGIFIGLVISGIVFQKEGFRW